MKIFQEEIKTSRLRLTRFTLDDSSQIAQLASDKDIASTTISIPHPYDENMAQEWIASHKESLKKGENIVWAIRLLEDSKLIGTIDLILNKRHHHAELGYWVGKNYWNLGLCTEAAKAVLAFAFQKMGLNKVFAHHMSRNPASGKVMQKMGMTHEGKLAKHYFKWEQYEDVEVYGILASDHLNQQGNKTL